MYEPDCTELDPIRRYDCDCGRSVRYGEACRGCGPLGRALELIQAIELERKLVLSLTGGTTNAATLSRLETLAKRMAVLRGYAARMERVRP